LAEIVANETQLNAGEQDMLAWIDQRQDEMLATLRTHVEIYTGTDNIEGIARPAVAIACLSLSSTGKVVYTLKTPYRDGTTQVAFSRSWRHPPEHPLTRCLFSWERNPRYHGSTSRDASAW
jgi:hypothetical protein